MLSVQQYSNGISNNQNNNVSFQAKRLRLNPPLRETFREISRDKNLNVWGKIQAKIIALVEKLAEPTVYVAENDADIEAFKKMRSHIWGNNLFAKLEEFFMWPAIKYNEYMEKRVKETIDKAKNIQ